MQDPASGNSGWDRTFTYGKQSICVCLCVCVCVCVCMCRMCVIHVCVWCMCVCLLQVCECVCVCVCVCVYVCVCMWLYPWLMAWAPRVQASLRQFFPSSFPSTSHQPHQSTQLWLGTWYFHETAPGGISVPTPLAVRKGLFSCKFLAQLQEPANAQASWLCQMRITASRLQENLCICAWSICWLHYRIPLHATTRTSAISSC